MKNLLTDALAYIAALFFNYYFILLNNICRFIDILKTK